MAIGKFSYDGFPDVVVSGLPMNDFRTVTYLIQNTGYGSFHVARDITFPKRFVVIVIKLRTGTNRRAEAN